MAKRQNFPRPVKDEIARRAVNAIGVRRCEVCHAVGVPLQLHHLIQDAMQTPEAKRKPLTAADGDMRCAACHDPETARQRVELSKVEKAAKAYWQPRAPSKMPGRQFDKREKVRTASAKVMARKPMFEGP